MNNSILQIIDGMTLEQKAAQLTQISYAHVTKAQAEEWARRGVGSFLHVIGDEARQLQKIAVKSGNVPIIFGIDAIHGHCINRKATVYPSQLSMACSWDAALVKQVARETAEEVTTDGVHWVFSPVLCLGRDIRWGRVDETFGEDGYLAGELGAAMVKGYQGDSETSAMSVVACAKHFIGYGEAIGGRDSYDSELTYRKLKDTFFPPFEKAFEAGCASVMTAYGSIDGTPCTVDDRLLKSILREEAGFDGFVVTDWDNITSLVSNQHSFENIEQASVAALNAGNDMMMFTSEFYNAIISAVRSGKVAEEELDKAVEHILTVKLRFGLFENPYKNTDKSVLACAEHLQTSKKIAQEAVVLLKNDGILPLDESLKIAVIGENAADIRAQYGDWTYFTHLVPNYDTAPERPFVTLLEGIQARAQTRYELGCQVLGECCEIEKAVETANKSDVVVFAFGDNVNISGEWHDLAKCELTENQQKLFDALCKTGKPIISVMIASKPMCIPYVIEKSNAVITNFNGGMFGGEALAQAIFGEINPSGKLPITFPYHTGQQPSHYGMLSGWHGSKYQDLPEKPLFSFGHGLSYTSYEYSDVVFDEKLLRLSLTVTNTGDKCGTEIIQVYFRDKVSTVLTPIKRLIAFERVELKAGESKRIDFVFTTKDFSFVNKAEKRVTEKGEFTIMVGGSSDDERLTMLDFTVDKDYSF